MLSCSIWFSAPSFWKGGSLESRCVGRVYGADGARQERGEDPWAISTWHREWTRLHLTSFHDLHSSPNIIRVIK